MLTSRNLSSGPCIIHFVDRKQICDTDSAPACLVLGATGCERPRAEACTYFQLGFHEDPFLNRRDDGRAGLDTTEATSMIVLSQDQMVDASTSIIHGVITEVWTEEDTKGVVWTRAQVEVTETWGDRTVKSYIVDQIGGRFGGNSTGMAGTAASAG